MPAAIYKSFARCLFVGFLSISSPAFAKAEASHPEESVSDMVFLGVDKNSLKAELRTLPQNAEASKLLSSFTIAIGREQGDKAKEGDNKTPEGIYFTQDHLDSNHLLRTKGKEMVQNKYGPWAIPLDFPNPMDSSEGVTGSGIWLHGAGNNKRIADKFTTEGCVAFYNEDILKLVSWLRPHQAPVVIANDLSRVNRPEDVKSVDQASRDWIKAWQNRDVDQYIAAYSPNFMMGGRNKSAYRNYKKQVFHSYKQIDLQMTQIRTITHPKYAVTFMNQDFSGDKRFRSVGRKVLYWHKQGDSWKILREQFGEARFSPLNFSSADLAKAFRKGKS